jgi:hypothetical protein
MELPKHPFVSLNQAVRNIANKYIASSWQRTLFLFFCKLWLTILAPEKAEQRIRNCFKSGQDGYLLTCRRSNALFYPEVSASFLLDTPEALPAKQATKLIVMALKFRERALNDTLEAEYEGDKPLDMRRYRYLFSRFTASELNNGKQVLKVTDSTPANHIIIAIDGLYYKLDVLQDDKIMAAAELYQQLSALIGAATAQLDTIDSPRFPFGLLTVVQNNKSAFLLSKLNDVSMEAINNALFFLAIDIHDSPKTLEEFGRVIHIKNFHNRDYRRSMQIVVTGNGKAGIIIDTTAGIGGTLSAHFASELAKDADFSEKELTDPVQPPLQERFLRLDFNTDALSLHELHVESFIKKVKAQSYDNSRNTVYRIASIGKKDFTNYDISADGVFHAALHLAFQRYFGKVPSVGNFINLRSVQHGDIFRYCSTTAEMIDFANDPNLENLKNAVRVHNELIKNIKSGADYFYQCFMTLGTMYHRHELSLASIAIFFLILQIFIKDFKRRFVNPDIWASHIPEFSGLAFSGRPGVKLDFLWKPSMAGHYMLFDNYTMICFLSNSGSKSYYGKERQFAAALRQCLHEIKAMISDGACHTC